MAKLRAGDVGSSRGDSQPVAVAAAAGSPEANAENSRLNAEINRLTAENNRLAAENSRLTADVTRVRAKFATTKTRLVTTEAELAAAKAVLTVNTKPATTKAGVSRQQEQKPITGGPESTTIEVQLGKEPVIDGVREIVSGLNSERRQEIKKMIDVAAAEVLTRYEISWESRREPMEAILKEIGIILLPPVCYTDQTPYETTHDGAYHPVHTIATRIELYLLGLRQRSGGNGEFYYSAEVYKFLNEVYKLL